MITVLTICYCACVFVAFKVIKIPVRPGTVAVAALVGVFGLGGIVIGWKFAAPISAQLTLKRNTVQLAILSKEMISKVHVTVDQPVKKGDLLFEVRTEPFQNAVAEATAQLAEAQQKVAKLEAGVEVASAAVEQAKASEGEAKAQIETALNVQKLNPSAVATLEVEVRRQNELAAQAGIVQATAGLQESQFALAAAKSGIAGIEAQLNTAKYNLERCVVKAPSDGFVMNLQAREGTMSRALNQSAIAVFMDTTQADVLAVFPQNQLKYVKPDDDVEIAFKSQPGQIATGKVVAVIKYTGEGQMFAESTVPIAADLGSKGNLVVRVKLDDPKLAQKLPLGAAGSLTIYTDFGNPFHLISKITIRIKGWMNYVPI